VRRDCCYIVTSGCGLCVQSLLQLQQMSTHPVQTLNALAKQCQQACLEFDTGTSAVPRTSQSAEIAAGSSMEDEGRRTSPA
jgi:hypothetical protein